MPNPKYGRAHQVERAKWRLVVEAGDAYCAEPVCLMPSRWIEPGPFDLAHDESGTVWIGPSHVRCNRTEGAYRRQHREVTKRWAL